MILEIQEVGQTHSAPAPPIEFVTMQLMPLSDGSISVALRTTVFDEQEFQLIDEEIVDGRVTTLDQVFEIVRSHLRIATAPSDFAGDRHG